MVNMPSSAIVALGIMLILYIVKYFHDRQNMLSRLPYPPGPKPLPVIGNLLDVPISRPWVTYANWKQQYGDLIHFRMFGHHVVVVNSREVAAELFDRRAGVYSDRPYMPTNELAGWDFGLGFQHYGDSWRVRRRMFHSRFNSRSVTAFHPTEVEHVGSLLVNLSKVPRDFQSHIRRYAGSLILQIVYGQRMGPEGDRLLEIIERPLQALGDMVLPSAQIVNTFPILRYLPEWAPGAGFQRRARLCRNLIDEMKNVPFSRVKEQIANDTAHPSVTADLLDKFAQTGDASSQETVKDVVAIAYVGAVDTTVSTLTSFFLAMTLHPDVQLKAQTEIDHVVGDDRLPGFQDRSSLPYINAVFQELLRWAVVAPVGLPHATVRDDVYNGYYIPKGTIVWGNIWAMTHDETLYPQPDEFRPERFLEGTEHEQLTNNANHVAFGFGRRVCAGRHMADESIWLAIASILAVFRIEKAKDENGHVCELRAEFTDDLVPRPLPFKCSITPRSSEAKSLLDQLRA